MTQNRTPITGGCYLKKKRELALPSERKQKGEVSLLDPVRDDVTFVFLSGAKAKKQKEDISCCQ